MGRKSDIIAIVSASTVTATGATAAFDISGYETGAILINVTAASGTSPTFRPYLQVSYDSTNWFGSVATSPAAAPADITATGQHYINISGYAGLYARLAYTVGGTTPSFTFSARALMRR